MKRKTPTTAPALESSPWTSDLKPARGDLRIVQAYVNTRDRTTDELVSPLALADWLAKWRLFPLGTQLEQADLERALTVREALRSLILSHSGVPVDAAAVARLDRIAAETPLCVRFNADGSTRYEPAAGGLAGAFGQLFEIIAAARRENLWTRLKICSNGDCRKVFYDFSPNRVGRWCMKGRCGNLINSRTFRRRHPNYYRYRY